MIKFTTFVIRKDHCRSCMACISACPNSAIVKLEDDSLEIMPSRCDSCGECLSACKLRAIKKTKRPHMFRS